MFRRPLLLPLPFPVGGDFQFPVGGDFQFPLPFPVGGDFQFPVNGNAQRFLATLLNKINKIFTLNQTKKLCLLLAYSDF